MTTNRSLAVQPPETLARHAPAMAAYDHLADSRSGPSVTAPGSPTGLLASALVHVLARDEPPPPRWQADAFVHAVADARDWLRAVVSTAELDLVTPKHGAQSFGTAVVALATDPLIAAIAVRRLELTRRQALPPWPVVVRRGLVPRVHESEVGRWFG